MRCQRGEWGKTTLRAKGSTLTVLVDVGQPDLVHYGGLFDVAGEVEVLGLLKSSVNPWVLDVDQAVKDAQVEPSVQ